jgi:hypothetical protein
MNNSGAVAKNTISSKLSRAKKTESSKPIDRKVLNESAEDFVEKLSKKNEKKKTEKILSEKNCSTEASTFLLQSCDALPKCPFCGKAFVVGQELKR